MSYDKDGNYFCEQCAHDEAGASEEQKRSKLLLQAGNAASAATGQGPQKSDEDDARNVMRGSHAHTKWAWFVKGYMAAATCDAGADCIHPGPANETPMVYDPEGEDAF